VKFVKQMDECLNRAVVEKNRPLNGRKWKAFTVRSGSEEILYLYHYHHRVLIYSLDSQRVLEEWWEKPTDKRGLDAAKAWLEAYAQEKPPLS
jgi:hypothetical protein